MNNSLRSRSDRTCPFGWHGRGHGKSEPLAIPNNGAFPRGVDRLSAGVLSLGRGVGRGGLRYLLLVRIGCADSARYRDLVCGPGRSGSDFAQVVKHETIVAELLQGGLSRRHLLRSHWSRRDAKQEKGTEPDSDLVHCEAPTFGRTAYSAPAERLEPTAAASRVTRAFQRREKCKMK